MFSVKHALFKTYVNNNGSFQVYIQNEIVLINVFLLTCERLLFFQNQCKKIDAFKKKDNLSTTLVPVIILDF